MIESSIAPELDQALFARDLHLIMASLPTQQFPQSYLQEYNGDSLRDIAIAFTVLTIVVVALRFYARSISKVKIGADDLFVLPSLLTCLGIVVLALHGAYTPDSSQKDI